MEKTIKIDGKDVRLKITAAFPLHFNALTGKDYFSHDSTAYRFYDVIWVAAKCADDSIQPVMEWVDSFGSFPVIDIFNEIQELITKTAVTTGLDRKNAKAATEK